MWVWRYDLKNAAMIKFYKKKPAYPKNCSYLRYIVFLQYRIILKANKPLKKICL